MPEAVRLTDINGTAITITNNKLDVNADINTGTISTGTDITVVYE